MSDSDSSDSTESGPPTVSEPQPLPDTFCLPCTPWVRNDLCLPRWAYSDKYDCSRDCLSIKKRKNDRSSRMWVAHATPAFVSNHTTRTVSLLSWDMFCVRFSPATSAHVAAGLITSEQAGVDFSRHRDKFPFLQVTFGQSELWFMLDLQRRRCTVFTKDRQMIVVENLPKQVLLACAMRDANTTCRIEMWRLKW